ncbi:MAG: hypothetical protein RJA99_4531 [Pseudomonadota bacterium]
MVAALRERDTLDEREIFEVTDCRPRRPVARTQIPDCLPGSDRVD